MMTECANNLATDWVTYFITWQTIHLILHLIISTGPKEAEVTSYSENMQQKKHKQSCETGKERAYDKGYR